MFFLVNDSAFCPWPIAQLPLSWFLFTCSLWLCGEIVSQLSMVSLPVLVPMVACSIDCFSVWLHIPALCLQHRLNSSLLHHCCLDFCHSHPKYSWLHTGVFASLVFPAGFGFFACLMSPSVCSLMVLLHTIELFCVCVQGMLATNLAAWSPGLYKALRGAPLCLYKQCIKVHHKLSCLL